MTCQGGGGGRRPGTTTPLGGMVGGCVIRAKKRDRVTMMMTPSSSDVVAISSSAAALARDDGEEEYECAVSFLGEFRSRHVTIALHSASLDSILEAGDCFVDEMLAGEFSLALSFVGGGRPSNLKSSSDDLVSAL